MNNGQPREHYQISIPKPDPSIFEGIGQGNIGKHLFQNVQEIFFVEKTEYPTEDAPAYNGDTGGIYVHKVGGSVKIVNGKTEITDRVKFLYPEKGFPLPQSAQANNIVKRFLIGYIRFFAANPLAVISLIRRKNLEKLIREFDSAAYIAFAPYYLKDERYQRAGREVMKFVYYFLKELNIAEILCSGFSKTCATILEHDNAYMLRLQDLANETDAQKLSKNPVKEFQRLVGIFLERDRRESMLVKVTSGLFLIRLAFLLPGIKKAFRKALKEIDFTKIQMDEGDRYHALRWEGYKVFGIEDEERHKKYEGLHNDKPPKGLLLQTLTPEMMAKQQKQNGNLN